MNHLSNAYRLAIDLLSAAETEYRRSLAVLDEARAGHLQEKITEAEASVLENKNAVRCALRAATDAHRKYWIARREALLPEISRAAELIHRYSRIALAAGVQGMSPGLSELQYAMHSITANEITEDVPIEGPDSELLA